jgi:hypothetical protein
MTETREVSKEWPFTETDAAEFGAINGYDTKIKAVRVTVKSGQVTFRECWDAKDEIWGDGVSVRITPAIWLDISEWLAWAVDFSLLPDSSFPDEVG